MKKLIFIFIYLCLLVVPISATINITSNVTQNSIDWSWNSGLTLTKLSVDGNTIPTFDNTTNEYISSNLNPNTKHTLNIYTSGDNGSGIATTLKASDDLSNLVAIINKWFFPLILPLIIFVIAIYLEAEFLAFIVTIISAVNIILVMAQNPVIWSDGMINVIVFIASLYLGFLGIDE
jgi:hypothetical protein